MLIPQASAGPKIKRQAVVLIHGIGEQRPMETLRHFVDAMLKDDRAPRQDAETIAYYSKPDAISKSYELRRIKLKKYGDLNTQWPETDFYEYYWAHHMSGTELKHVFAWLRRLLGRSWKDMRTVDQSSPDPAARSPRSSGGAPRARKVVDNPVHHCGLRRLYTGVWLALALLIAGVVLAAWTVSRWDVGIAVSGVAALLLTGIYQGARYLVLGAATNVIGGAARYLDVAPANVSRRYAIIRGGIDMLAGLHEHKVENPENGDVRYTYDRIVVIGHSLGSIIGYDLLKHYWGGINGRMPVDVQSRALTEVEDFRRCRLNGSERAHSNAHRFRLTQHALWLTLNDKWLGRDTVPKQELPPARWLVTDFITLGSPLSYGALLLADSLPDFTRKQALRELPICPPDRSRHDRPGGYAVPLKAESNSFLFFDILHHAALFSVTRWANCYFPNDPIAGSVKNVFGAGVRDIPLGVVPRPFRHPLQWLRSHTSYWDVGSSLRSDSSKCSRSEVRQILARISLGDAAAALTPGDGGQRSC